VRSDDWKSDAARGSGRGARRDEDLARTVALGGIPAPAGALDDTLPASGAPRDKYGRVDDHGAFDGGQYGEYRIVAPPSGVDEYAVPRRGSGGRIARRALFATAGLMLVGGGGYAAARTLSGRASRVGLLGSNSPAPGPSSAQPSSPQSQSPSSAAASPTASSPPVDLSSSPAGSGSGSPSASASAPASGGPTGSTDPSQVRTTPQYYVEAGPKMIALTLDDGPSNVYTPQILDLLDKYQIKATFCMIGGQIAANRSLVREVADAGHVIVNHTWDHADQSKLSLSGVRSEISRTNDALADVGVHPAVFRAPYGAWSAAVFQACADAGLRPLDWSVDPRDWSRPGTNTIVQRILANTRTGSIILEHDGGGDRSQTVAALKIVLPQLLQDGYRFTHV
jgi:peptidoglycan/xylan/chitin deacetylase (PgdA/CDA1 family)